MSPPLAAIDQLPTAPASTIKKVGWKGVMRSLASSGQLVVTNHAEPEAVILSIAEYSKLVAASQLTADALADPLQALRERFDARLASLQSPDAGEKLRQLIRKPGALDGKVKAGRSY